ncbi:MAG: AAA family ATPase, partial [Ktedonobacterales bacterium]
RAGYNPELRQYSCFHGAHGVKDAQDLDAWLRQNVPGYVQMRYDLVRKAFAMSPLPPDTSGVASGATAARSGLVSILQAPPQTAMPARRSVCSHLARGEVSYRIGAPGGGKSAIALAYALGLVFDKPDLIGEQKIERLGDVIIVSNEDNADDYRKRLTGLLLKHGLLGQKPKFDILVTPTQNFAVVERKSRYDAFELGEDMAWLEAQMAQRPNGVALVIIDTQAATFRGVDENSNADMGAAMAKVAEWSKRLDVASEVIHHGVKSNGTSEGGGRLTSARGASAAGGSVRNALTLTTLDRDEIAKLPPGEGQTWVREDGAKGNHSGVRGRKWWQRELLDVIVDDNGSPDTQTVPVYVYRATGPKGLDFKATDATVQRQLVHIVAEAERADDPFRVRKANGGTGLSDVLVDAFGWTPDDAKEAIAEGQRLGNLEQHEWKNPKNRREVCVWGATTKGLDLLQEDGDVLQKTDD